MDKILERLDKLDSYIKYTQSSQDDSLTEFIAKLNIIDEKIDRMLVRENKTIIEKKYKNDYEEAQVKNKENNKVGQIRVGRIHTMQDKGRKTPITFGFMNVAIISGPGKKTLGRELDPNYLKYDGKILQNIWEFSKIYPQHLNIKCTNLTPYIKNINEFIKPEYWQWRENGFQSTSPIRYPFGMQAFGDHVGFISGTKDSAEFYSEFDARIKIFAPIYKKVAQKTDDYKKLTELINDGYNLQLCDLHVLAGTLVNLNIDQRKGVYGEDQVGSIAINSEIINKLLNSKHEFTQSLYVAAFLCDLL